jgi:hypothetical protein
MLNPPSLPYQAGGAFGGGITSIPKPLPALPQQAAPQAQAQMGLRQQRDPRMPRDPRTPRLPLRQRMAGMPSMGGLDGVLASFGQRFGAPQTNPLANRMPMAGQLGGAALPDRNFLTRRQSY